MIGRISFTHGYSGAVRVEGGVLDGASIRATEIVCVILDRYDGAVGAIRAIGDTPIIKEGRIGAVRAAKIVYVIVDRY